MAAKGALRAAGALVAVVMLTAAGWGSWERFHGTVVDAETGKPIPEAVVVLEWVKRHRLGMDGPEYLQNVQEVVTDAEGRYSVQASPGINWNPISYLYRLKVLIFALDYEPANPAFVVIKGYESSMEALTVLENGAVTRLQPLKASSRIREILNLDTLSPDTVRHAPNVRRVVNEQRRRLGLKDLPLPE